MTAGGQPARQLESGERGETTQPFPVEPPPLPNIDNTYPAFNTRASCTYGNPTNRKVGTSEKLLTVVVVRLDN